MPCLSLFENFHHIEFKMTTDSLADQSEPPKNADSQADSSRKASESGESSKESPSERQALLRLSSAGFELASFSLILGAVGYGVDQAASNENPYVGIAGLLLGFALGFYRLIVLATKLS